jgi:hypothetical protein
MIQAELTLATTLGHALQCNNMTRAVAYQNGGTQVIAVGMAIAVTTPPCVALNRQGDMTIDGCGLV